MKKTIYNLELHQTLYVKDKELKIQRVPSGWNYIYIKEIYDHDDNRYKWVVDYIVFVPYDNSFINKT